MGNLKPSHAYLVRAETILRQPMEIERKTIEERLLLTRQIAAKTETHTSQPFCLKIAP